MPVISSYSKSFRGKDLSAEEIAKALGVGGESLCFAGT
jgi:hypothetical protein